MFLSPPKTLGHIFTEGWSFRSSPAPSTSQGPVVLADELFTYHGEEEGGRQLDEQLAYDRQLASCSSFETDCAEVFR